LTDDESAAAPALANALIDFGAGTLRQSTFSRSKYSFFVGKRSVNNSPVDQFIDFDSVGVVQSQWCGAGIP
jgi:hypothetical protein